MRTATDRPRILFALGPGDVIESFRKWKAGIDPISETSRTFSGQIFDFCRENGVHAYALSSNPARGCLADEFLVENRPTPLARPRGALYHVNQIWCGLSLIVSALRFRADAVVVDSGTTHWFVLTPLAWARIRVIACLHNSLAPVGTARRGPIMRLIAGLDGRFWRRHLDAALCCSPALERQAEALGGSDGRLLVVPFRAQFRRRFFEPVPPPPPHEQRPFRVLFAGRIEPEKGVFDLLEIAERLEVQMPGRFRFEVCGRGSALDELTQRVEGRGLSDIVLLRGALDRPALLEAYARSHVVIVPTRSGIGEGMPMVAAEATLMRRPVLTTRLTNTLDVLGEAVVEATPDDPGSYAAGLQRLAGERELYERCCRACLEVRSQFIDPERGLGTSLARTLAAVGLGTLAPSSDRYNEPVSL